MPVKIKSKRCRYTMRSYPAKWMCPSSERGRRRSRSRMRKRTCPELRYSRMQYHRPRSPRIRQILAIKVEGCSWWRRIRTSWIRKGCLIMRNLLLSSSKTYRSSKNHSMLSSLGGATAIGIRRNCSARSEARVCILKWVWVATRIGCRTKTLLGTRDL